MQVQEYLSPECRKLCRGMAIKTVGVTPRTVTPADAGYYTSSVLDVVRTLRPLVRREDSLSQPDALGCDLDELVVVDELNGLLQTQYSRRNQANGLVGARRAHVGLLLFLRDVHVHVAR